MQHVIERFYNVIAAFSSIMSAKQFRRYLEVTGRLKTEDEILRAGLSLPSDDEPEEEEPRTGNRYAITC